MNGGEPLGAVPGHADRLLDLLAHGLQRDPEGLEGLGRDALTLVDETQQDVLGPDEAVIEQARFLLRQHQHPPCPVGEAFEHPDRLSLSLFLSVQCTCGPQSDTAAHPCRARRTRPCQRRSSGHPPP